MSSGTLTIEDLEAAATSAIANAGMPDQMIFSGNVSSLMNMFRSDAYHKIKRMIPGFPDNVSDEQIQSMTKTEKEMAKVLYGSNKAKKRA